MPRPERACPPGAVLAMKSNIEDQYRTAVDFEKPDESRAKIRYR
jgi:hypothetical protein